MGTANGHERLIPLLADGRFHSGQALGARLGITRAAVAKQISKLRELGLAIEAVHGRGYRFARPLELLDSNSILEAVPEDSRGYLHRIDLFTSIDSTNRALASASLAGAPSGTVCLAEFQSAGRGRRGRKWISPYGANLYLSLLWRFDMGAAQLGPLSLVVAIEIARLLREFTETPLGIKWPNDILVEGRKLCGILLELSGEATGPCHVVIGIGLNYTMEANQADGIDQPWCSLAALDTGLSRNELAGKIIGRLLCALARYPVEGFSPYRELWGDFDLLADKEVTLSFPGRDIIGIAAGVDRQGALVVRHNGKLSSFSSGEVSVRPGAAV